MKIPFGGRRVGSGNKMDISLHNYSRSTHNLSESFRSSAAPGVLYPFYVCPAVNGDTFDIDLNAMAKTLPTNGPLLGSFKLQLDMYLVPMRLYQGILHNNAINIGLNMSKVKFPSMKLETKFKRENTETKPFKTCQINPTTLVKYLGLSGICEKDQYDSGSGITVSREFNAIPMLAYYDIFKCYYANKQENYAYVISGSEITGGNIKFTISTVNNITAIIDEDEIYTKTFLNLSNDSNNAFTFYGDNLKENIGANIVIDTELEPEEFPTLEELINVYPAFKLEYGTDQRGQYAKLILKKEEEISEEFIVHSLKFKMGEIPTQLNDVYLEAFKLENIDKMRQRILSLNDISDQLVIDKTETLEPYSIVTGVTNSGVGKNIYEMNGLVVKTYQSDLFNNWLNTEWIDGENGILAVTTVDTTDGLNLDALNFAQKVYNMLNRVAVADGTFQGWQEAVYTEKTLAHAETPIYCGGMSGEIGFEEITSTAATEENPLGTLAGKGKLYSSKGGNIIIKATEPSFIIGIMSITPRIDYCEGNAWYMTELKTMDDLHKPALDGIGFQDLLGEQMAWWDTVQDASDPDKYYRNCVGKVPAWINYMTAIDKVFGDFARPDGKNFMVLTRDYDLTQSGTAIEVMDFTTYIDPSKFNYAFTDASLTAQNFWIQILTKVVARRKMSAKIIPNL